VTRGIEDEVGSFLARWSRRKAAARRGAPEPEPHPPVAPAAEEAAGPRPDEGGPVEPRTDPRPGSETRPAEFDLAKLPDPDTLDATSDFSVFMQPGVPAELKRRALRRLWKVNPIISTPDGTDDYYIVTDFSDASTVVADLKTVYRVGRGMVAALEELAGEPGAPPVAEAAEVATGSSVQSRPASGPGLASTDDATAERARAQPAELASLPAATPLSARWSGSSVEGLEARTRGGGGDRTG
jgi:hypothetical protein